MLRNPQTCQKYFETVEIEQGRVLALQKKQMLFFCQRRQILPSRVRVMGESQ